MTSTQDPTEAVSGLIERIERADGVPSLALNLLSAEVAIAADKVPEGYEQAVVHGVLEPYFWHKTDSHAAYWSPGYLSSIDAAMTLVPEGCPEWHAGKHFKTGKGQAYIISPDVLPDPIYVLAATPALALCAAALRARETTPSIKGGDRG